MILDGIDEEPNDRQDDEEDDDDDRDGDVALDHRGDLDPSGSSGGLIQG